MQGRVFSGFLEILEERAHAAPPPQRERPSPVEHDTTEAEERAYGQRIFQRFADLYPGFFEDASHPLDLLESLTRTGKPDSRTSLLSTERPRPDLLILDYRSDRPSPQICCGLIEGCAALYSYKVDIWALPIISAEVRYKFHVTLKDRRGGPLH